MDNNINITSAQYIQDENDNNVSIKIIIDNIEWFVPLDPDNRHYQAIQKWVAEGNKIEDAD